MSEKSLSELTEEFNEIRLKYDGRSGPGNILS